MAIDTIHSTLDEKFAGKNNGQQVNPVLDTAEFAVRVSVFRLQLRPNQRFPNAHVEHQCSSSGR